MPVLSGLAVFLQDSPQTQGDIHLSTVYLGIIAITLLVLVLTLLIGGAVAALFVVKRVKAIEKLAKTAELKAIPIILKANDLVRDLAPRIKSITENAEQVSYTVRAKADELADTVSELNETVREINGRTRVQVTRVDGIVSEALTTTEEISQTVQNGIRVPVRQIAGIVAGVRAGIETLVERSPFNRSAQREPRRYGSGSGPSPLDL